MSRFLRGCRMLAIGCESIRNGSNFIENSEDNNLNLNLNQKNFKIDQNGYSNYKFNKLQISKMPHSKYTVSDNHIKESWAECKNESLTTKALEIFSFKTNKEPEDYYLPPEISLDERIITTFQAIKLFFEAKEAMKNHLDMTDAEINLMKYKIKAFATFMKTNLGSLKLKQKGDLMLFELPEFVSIFKTASFFSDNAIESCHPIHNSQERRIKCKQDPTRYSLLLKWAIDNNYYFDNIDCKSYEEK